MRPDSTITAYLTEHAGEHGSLPLPVLIVLLLMLFSIGVLTAYKLGNIKAFLGEPPFPTHAATVVAAIIVFLGLGVIAICRAALGMEWPPNYNIIVEMVMAGMLGVAAWGIGKRVTSAEAYDGKAKVEAAKNGAVPVDMKTTTERPIPAPSRATDAMPQAGVAPKNPGVKVPLENYAAQQRTAIDGEGD